VEQHWIGENFRELKVNLTMDALLLGRLLEKLG